MTCFRLPIACLFLIELSLAGNLAQEVEPNATYPTKHTALGRAKPTISHQSKADDTKDDTASGRLDSYEAHDRDDDHDGDSGRSRSFLNDISGAAESFVPTVRFINQDVKVSTDSMNYPAPIRSPALVQNLPVRVNQTQKHSYQVPAQNQSTPLKATTPAEYCSVRINKYRKKVRALRRMVKRLELRLGQGLE